MLSYSERPYCWLVKNTVAFLQYHISSYQYMSWTKREKQRLSLAASSDTSKVILWLSCRRTLCILKWKLNILLRYVSKQALFTDSLYQWFYFFFALPIPVTFLGETDSFSFSFTGNSSLSENKFVFIYFHRLEK